ncbi:hypothetical protein ACH5RR_037402 [Cinchona calisaya]|uniref:Uncharacterized protein n=1 Tax=Cinchona calisaya TaxID=153742 RepID=A0ABD2YBK2_9GENT
MLLFSVAYLIKLFVTDKLGLFDPETRLDGELVEVGYSLLQLCCCSMDFGDGDACRAGTRQGIRWGKGPGPSSFSAADQYEARVVCQLCFKPGHNATYCRPSSHQSLSISPIPEVLKSFQAMTLSDPPTNA